MKRKSSINKRTKSSTKKRYSSRRGGFNIKDISGKKAKATAAVSAETERNNRRKLVEDASKKELMERKNKDVEKRKVADANEKQKQKEDKEVASRKLAAANEEQIKKTMMDKKNEQDRIKIQKMIDDCKGKPGFFWDGKKCSVSKFNSLESTLKKGLNDQKQQYQKKIDDCKGKPGFFWDGKKCSVSKFNSLESTIKKGYQMKKPCGPKNRPDLKKEECVSPCKWDESKIPGDPWCHYGGKKRHSTRKNSVRDNERNSFSTRRRRTKKSKSKRRH
jgi:flagellar biosynthesis GTPase FlhF